MPANNNLEAQILGHLFGASTWVKPTTLYVAALTATPADVGGFVEVAASEYSRQQLDPSDTNWLEQTDSSRINGAAITFADPLTDWGDVTAIAVFADATGGDPLAWGDLATPETVTAGGALLMIMPGQLSWKMNLI